jgi:hypothetical protein
VYKRKEEKKKRARNKRKDLRYLLVEKEAEG